MFTLYLKEIRSFLSSLIGYMAIGVFLTLLGVFLWIIPTEAGGANILDNGFANIDPLFYIGPWVYLFLIPAITMRTFSEEKKTGTIELLLTRPLTDFQIVMAKYLAGFSLVIISLLPTLIYYYSVHVLGYPKGNMDTGAMWGSYIGLLMLGAGFVAIGVFASSISENQVIAFIIALLLCFFMYTGFDFISQASLFGGLSPVIKGLGINEHYLSLSRGVVDTRDVIYFVSLIAVFILLTKLNLESRKW
ncbi:MAG: gliding motility-associated ABC transporter permease subunit GldF [Flavobacteriales bacterium]|nr:gliding motility-associated ABC transporter permease subunit GldF [Flavobacteriales bacterium]